MAAVPPVTTPAIPVFSARQDAEVGDGKRSRSLKAGRPLETGLELLPLETTREFFEKRVRAARRPVEGAAR